MSRLTPQGCKSCPAMVLWLENDRTGSRAPIDVDPVPDGNITIDPDAGTYHVLGKDEAKPACTICTGRGNYDADGITKRCTNCDGTGLRPVRKNHFATCPEGPRWKGRTRANAGGTP